MTVSAARPVYVVLLGAPGAGKGTQAEALGRRLGMPRVASGDLFRENRRNRTQLGLLAESYMDRGELVPDNVTIGMVIERLSRADCARGAILDGFPRTVEQAKALDEALAARGSRIAVAVYIQVSNEELVRRLSGRWLCRGCDAIYHIEFNPPRVASVCDKCGGELYQRDDDRPETVRRRLEVYLQQTMPVIAYYREKGLLAEIDGEQSVEAVQAALEKVIPDI
jgi:adenylate kinase